MEVLEMEVVEDLVVADMVAMEDMVAVEMVGMEDMVAADTVGVEDLEAEAAVALAVEENNNCQLKVHNFMLTILDRMSV